MNLYPALCCTQGTWTYYSVKMSARELSLNVKFAQDIYKDKTLGEAIQRILKEERVNKEIALYLKRQPDHFFSSIVVAALKGNPKFYPVEVTDNATFAIFRDDQRLNNSFGVLSFDGTQEYYALDGQHRLSAIKTLLDRSNPLSDGVPESFVDDEYSVIVVVPSEEESKEEGHATFMQKYRRLFANLNRYAKPTDHATNIIMDEDDAFAILTRRLITEHKFFRSAGIERESIKVKTRKGKNLNSTDPFFTSIEALYEVNIRLLNSNYRRNRGWGSDTDNLVRDDKLFRRFRPSDEYLDLLYDELTIYWDAILEEIPDLQNTPSKMRVHNLLEQRDNDETDHLLFWPIGQELLADIVRFLLDKKIPEGEAPNKNNVSKAIKRLGQLEWHLHQPPWRHFVLVPQSLEPPFRRWRMRNEERKPVLRQAQIIQQWVLGGESLDEVALESLRLKWDTFLLPSMSGHDKDKMWKQVEELKEKLSS